MPWKCAQSGALPSPLLNEKRTAAGQGDENHNNSQMLVPGELEAVSFSSKTVHQSRIASLESAIQIQHVTMCRAAPRHKPSRDFYKQSDIPGDAHERTVNSRPAISYFIQVVHGRRFVPAPFSRCVRLLSTLRIYRLSVAVKDAVSIR